MPWAVLFWGSVLLVVILAAVLPIVRGQALARKSVRWPKASGKITALAPQFSYEYQVSGRTYRSSNLAFGLPASPPPLNLQVDQPVTVYYDPERPTDATLMTGGSAFRRFLIDRQRSLVILFTVGISTTFFVVALLRAFNP